MLTKERKKQLDIDLWIILIISMLSLGIYMIFNRLCQWTSVVFSGRSS